VKNRICFNPTCMTHICKTNVEGHSPVAIYVADNS